MTITDIIKERRSLRSYNGQALDAETTKELQTYLKNLPQPLGGSARIELVTPRMGSEPVKLGTYGVISGAADFLVLAYEEGPLAAANAGYMFEQAVLKCTQMGLGTCWLGGTFRKSGFAQAAKVRDNELVRIVSPVGRVAAKPKFRDRLMRAGAGSDRRKPFGQLFFEGDFSTPLTTEGKYALPLEMVRLAPSASNTQPWRALVDGNDVHFYFQQKSHLTDIDMGIALCHFELTCREEGITGLYTVRNDIPTAEGSEYLISWIADK